MLAYSRVLDAAEMLIVMNLRGEKYTNHVVMDKALTPPGTVIRDLLGRATYLVEDRSSRAAAAITLPPYSMAIFKQKGGKS